MVTLGDRYRNEQSYRMGAQVIRRRLRDRARAVRRRAIHRRGRAILVTHRQVDRLSLAGPRRSGWGWDRQRRRLGHPPSQLGAV